METEEREDLVHQGDNLEEQHALPAAKRVKNESDEGKTFRVSLSSSGNADGVAEVRVLHQPNPHGTQVRKVFASVKCYFSQNVLSSSSERLKITVRMDAQPKILAPKKPHLAENLAKDEMVLNRIAQLQQHGLWTGKRLQKLHEPQRTKVHWDYLLAEMSWLANDFMQERKWKKAVSKKLSKAVLKHHRQIAMSGKKMEKEEDQKIRRYMS